MTEPVESVEEIFSQLSREDEEKLISLPYRVGLFVSFADTTGGWDAQEAEMQTLNNILREFAEDFCKSEFSQKVLMESLGRKTLWPSWSQNVERVPDEAAYIIDMLKSFFEDKPLRAFKEVLVDIALSVAMAFREQEVLEEETARPSLVHDLLSRLKRSRTQPQPLSHMNISAEERQALAHLCRALDHEIQ